jgi:dUTP diphosphatase
MLKIVKTRDVKTPQRGSEGSAGFDFFIPNDMEWETKTLHPHEDINIPSGIHVKFPSGSALIAFNKSGQATKKGLQIGASVVDGDYQGEVHLHVRNISSKECFISRGEKLIQLVLIPVIMTEVLELDTLEELYSTKGWRGDAGFGSTGTV